MAIYSLHHRPITRTGKCAQKRAYTSAAHCSYITRESAVTAILGHHIPTDPSAACRWLVRMEDGEARKNARFIEKVIIALPIELSHKQRAALVEDFCHTLARARMPWLAAIHDGPLDWDNPHAHIILRDRDIETGKTVIQASDFKSTNRFRELWEAKANEHLARAGLSARIDRRSLKEQGLAREPGIHVGPRARAMAERGAHTASKVITVQRFSNGRMQHVRVDYAAIDNGHSRDTENAARRARNAARGLLPRTLKWNDGAGMVSQQRSAMRWVKRSEWRKAYADRDKTKNRETPIRASVPDKAKGLEFFEDRHTPGHDRTR